MKNFVVLAILAFVLPVSAEIKVLALSGSSREDSLNTKLVMDAADIAKKMGCSVNVIDLKDYPMPFYNADLEKKGGMPTSVKRFREQMVKSDAIIIASPEYNGSIPAILKNALDWASRSEEGGPSRAAFKGKRFALMSASPGPGGGSRGLVHLKAIIEEVGGTVVPRQVSIPNAPKYFSEKNRPENPLLKEEIVELIQPLQAKQEAGG